MRSRVTPSVHTALDGVAFAESHAAHCLSRKHHATGYELHVNRADDWRDNAAMEISAEEWLRVVAEDPELRLAGDNGPCFAIWRGLVEHPQCDEPPARLVRGQHQHEAA